MEDNMQIDNLDKQPTLNIKLKNQQFVAVEYWWENNDFFFVTDNDEKYCFANAYPISMQIDGLDFSSTEDVVMVGNKTLFQDE